MLRINLELITLLLLSINLIVEGAGQYEHISDHIGCHYKHNLGYIGRPMDFLSDVSSRCEGGDSKCIELGKIACDTNPECWGFGVHHGWGVQLYNDKAMDTRYCNGIYGLLRNTHWDTYRKKNGACADKSSLCKSLEMVCQHEWFSNIMEHNCRKTCGFCGPDTITCTKSSQCPVSKPSCRDGLCKSPCQYNLIGGHIGCHHPDGHNFGYIGRPRDYLIDESSTCKTGDARCIELGKRACDYVPSCVGFGIHRGWGIQLYDKAAKNKFFCNGREGLHVNTKWNTYMKHKCN